MRPVEQHRDLVVSFDPPQIHQYVRVPDGELPYRWGNRQHP
jgi:hypothetical protein